MSTLQARTSRCFSEVGDSLCCGWIWMLMEGYCWSTWSLLVPICQRAFSVSNALMPRVRWVRKRASEIGSCKLSQNWLLGCLTDLHPSGKGAWEHTKACFSLCRSWGRFHRMGNLQSWKILMTHKLSWSVRLGWEKQPHLSADRCDFFQACFPLHTRALEFLLGRCISIFQ